jgi:N-acetylmuramoyl-L-alanine amidase
MRLRKMCRKMAVYLMVLSLALGGFHIDKVFAAELPVMMQLDTIIEGSTLTGTTALSGWAVGVSGIQKVELSVDGGTKEQLSFNAPRADVGVMFPNYLNAGNSGFTYNMNTRKYSNGDHQLSIVATGIDGQVLVKQWKISINNPQTPIMGQSVVTKEQMIRYFQNKNYVKSYKYINDFVNMLWEEATIEGIRPDVAFAQMMKETAFLKFGGDVKEEQNNFGGIGATGNGAPGYSFKDIRTGIRVNIQHLKAYASKEPLKQAVVDPRYSLVTKGTAPYVEWLGTKENPYGYGWATGANYGYDIVYRVSVMKDIAVTSGTAKLTEFVLGSEFLPGRVYTISASGTSTNRILYQYWVKDYSKGTWTLAQDYSESGIFKWNTATAGSYRIKVNVRDVYSNKEFDHSVYKDVIVAAGSNSSGQDQLQGVKIVLDAGHGGSDPGALGNGYKEKDLNIQIVQNLGEKLKNLGADVLYTRQPSNDVYVDLSERTKFANDNNADLFLSIHHDASSNSTAGGTSAFYSTFRPGVETADAYFDYNGNKYKVLYEKDGYLYYDDNGVIKSESINNVTAYDPTPSEAAAKSASLAKTLVDALANLGVSNRGTKDRNLYVTRWTNMPSVLIETGFITNFDEINKIASPSYQNLIAQKIVDVIKAFFSR